MFEVTIFVEDNKLSSVLWQLDGLIVGQPQLLPVRGAKITKNKKTIKAAFDHGTIDEIVANEIHLSGAEKISSTSILSILTENKISKSSYGKVVTTLIQKGILLRTGKGQFHVQKGEK